MKNSKPGKLPRKFEAHIYMDEADYRVLKSAADRELRSVAAQALHYIRQCLEGENSR